MAANNRFSLLESLPQDLLGEILSRVARSSREDIAHCVTVSKTISGAVQDERVFKSMNLRPQAMSPLTTYEHHHQLMQRCLESDNPAASYIEGVKLFFVHDSTPIGLHFLKKSAEGKFDNRTYLYGILMLLMGNRVEGRKFLDSLGWKTNKRRGDRFWWEIKTSLRYIEIDMKYVYSASLSSSKPLEQCHLNDLENRCRKCYYYKQMRKFIMFIL